MAYQNISSLSQVLASMEMLEKKIAELYGLAAQHWPEDAELWQDMAKAEINHAGYIKALGALITSNPQKFAFNRAINIAAVNSSISWIDKNITDIKSGAFNNIKMYILARDLEQSILEAKYAEIVRTDDLEYQKITNLIIAETTNHKKLIDEKIAKVNKK